MATAPETAPRVLTTRLLAASDGPAAWRFLARSGIRDVYVASQIWGGALEHCSTEGGPDFHGVFDGSILCALLYLGNGALAVPAGKGSDELMVLGPILSEYAKKLRALIGDRDAVTTLLPFVTAAGCRPRVDVPEMFLEVDATTLDSQAREGELRKATLKDLDLVAEASSRAHGEEMGDDPMATNAVVFLGRVARQILDERIFVIRRGGELIFKAELSAKCPIGAQISGVYTHPAHRGRGYAKRGTGEVAWRAFAEAPRVCLFVRHDNMPARRAYERIGFAHTGEFRTLFFESSKKA